MTTPRGFIALLSAVIIAAILLLLATTGSVIGFYNRTTAYSSEMKERASALAESCVAHTMLALTLDNTYAGSATTSTSGGSCYTSAVTKTGSGSGASYTFRTRGYYQNAYTTYKVTATGLSPTLTKLEELANY